MTLILSRSTVSGSVLTMHNDIAYLCTSVITQDTYGNEVEEYTYRKIFVKPSSISQSEFYAAATAELKPNLKLTIADYSDYNDEKYVKYEEVMYDVTRTYRNGLYMELTLTEKIGREE